MAHVWRHREGSLLATTMTGRNGSRFHLNVEIIPNGDWDWIVWRAGDSYDVRYGVARSTEAAMAAAEAAAGRLAETEAILADAY